MERIKLTVLEVREPQKIGTQGAEKLCFKGKDAAGGAFQYCTFTKALFEAIKAAQGKEIEVDMEVTSREANGTTYTDRKVSQVYVGGQPVNKPAPGRTFGGHGESPEARASIETQVAFKGIVDLMIAKMIPTNHALSLGAMEWARARLPKRETNGV